LFHCLGEFKSVQIPCKQKSHIPLHYRPSNVENKIVSRSEVGEVVSMRYKNISIPYNPLMTKLYFSDLKTQLLLPVNTLCLGYKTR